MKILKLFLFLLFVPALAFAAAGPGDALPHSLEAPDQNGVPQSFESLKGDKGMVLVFVRSADWCPYCQAQLIDLGERGPEITDLGYSIVTLSYDAPDKLKHFADKYAFEYMMLSDPDSEIIKAFGILNEDIEPDSPYYGIPNPTIYVIGKDGHIQAKLAEEGYKKRPAVDAITESIKMRP